jgi:hypothetical protein
MAALRERETSTAEMFSAAPIGYRERTLALLAAGLVPTALAGALAALQLGVIVDAGGITVYDMRLTPSVIEMGLVPAITATSFASGVALARTIRSRTVGVVWGAVATYTLFLMYWVLAWFPASFVHPYSTALRAVDLGTTRPAVEWTKDLLPMDLLPPDPWHPNWWTVERDVGIVGWHIAYLAGITLLLAAYAVRRSGPERRVRWMVVSGAVLTIAGLALQMAAFGIPLTTYL